MSGLARGGRALVCAPLPPEYDQEAGSQRIYHTITFLLEAGMRVAFVCENAQPNSRHLRHLRQLGVPTYVGFGERTEELIEAGSFDLAVFAFWELANRHADLVRRLSPGTRIVVDSVDLHWLRKARQAFGNGPDAAGKLDGDFGQELVGEISTYARADAVLTVSTREAELIHEITGTTDLAWAVPQWDDTPPSPVSFEARQGIVFVGNFRHTPNLDAVKYLCAEILPRLPRKLRERHPLRIVGNGLDSKVEAAVAGCSDVELVGWVPSVTPYLHVARATVVPLRYGAGTKRKLIEALLARTPTVSTPIGAEGLDLVDGRHLMVAADAAAIARALERVLTDAELWEKLASQGRRQMLRLYGRAPVHARMHEIFGGVMKRARRSSHIETSKPDARTQAIEAVRRAVTTALPTGSAVLVVSRGDPELVKLSQCKGRHFPSTPDGRYAGFHPADSKAALQELERRLDDAQYLLIPASSFWWLDYYREFADVLNTRYERVWSDSDCVIFRLSAPQPTVPPKRLRGVVVAPPTAVRGNGHKKGLEPRRESLR